MQTSAVSSSPSEPSTLTAASLLNRKFPTLGRFWPNLPQASAPQTAFLLLDTEEAFYGGAAGGGKSDALLAGALEYVDVPRYAALILRRTYTDLSLPGAIMSRSAEWLQGLAHWNHDRKTWTFPAGATVTFGYLDNERDMFRYQSAEFQYIAFDELTQFTEKQFEYMFSRLRATEDVRVPLRMRAGSNPGGIGHGWVKKRYVTGRAPGVIYVPAKLDDHPDESFKAGYRRSLAKLDDVTRRQYEDGDWDVAEGLAFHVIPAAHVVPDMEIPGAWERRESMDFGVANPTCVLVWASDYDGNHLVFDSYYQGNTLVSGHAAAIEARRRVWWPEGQTPTCYADPSMWNRKGGITRWGEPASDVTEFQEHGVDGLVAANNNRRPGRIRVAELLRCVEGRPFPAWHPRYGETGSPRLFVVGARCPELVEQMMAAPLLPTESGKQGAGEIIDPDWETQHGHATAALRYGAMSWPEASAQPKPEPESPQAAVLQRYEQRQERPDRDRSYAI